MTMEEKNVFFLKFFTKSGDEKWACFTKTR